MSKQGEISFQVHDLFAGQTGVVDRGNCVIRGVAVIKNGVCAEGHNLNVDDTTIQQLQSSAKERGKIAVTLDHGSGVKDLNGYLTAFRVDGDTLRADWHLLKTHDQTPTMLERAEMMPNCFGLSCAFKGPPAGERINGKQMARCEKLLSVDAVTRPAATDGLFAVPGTLPVDNAIKDMPQDNASVKEPTIADLMAKLDEISKVQAEHQQFIQSAQTQNEPTLEDFHNASDEELAAFNQERGTNITRQDINAAVAEAVQAAEAGEGDKGGENGEVVKDGEPVAATGGVDASPAGASMAGGVSGDGSATFQALSKRLVELESKIQAKELKEKKDAEDFELAAIEEKALKLANQRDEAIKLSKKYEAENQALRLAAKTGTRPVTAGVDNDVRLFSANIEGQLHQFQVRVKQIEEGGKTNAQAILLAQKENPGLHADWVQSLNGSTIHA